MIDLYFIDGDTTCLNDTLLYWSNMAVPLNPCDYFSFLDTDELGEDYQINYEEYVSFGEAWVDEEPLSTTYIEYPPLKYYLVANYIMPRDFYSLLPSVALTCFLMAGLFLIVQRFLMPINIIKKYI